MTTLQIAMHPAQRIIHDHPARFKVVAAGRRFGKTILAVIECILSGLAEENRSGVKLRSDSEVVYIGVDREQARRNAWHYFKDFTRGIGATFHENTSVITLPNGVRIRLLGMDNPDAARGMKLRFAVLDEYADMPPHVWPEIIRPALMDVKGEALFIGTPKGKNHFFELFQSCPPHGTRKNWYAFNFSSDDNPFIDPEEREDIKFDLSREQEMQELEAKFITRSGRIFNADDFKFDTNEPKNGSYVITVDLAGFQTEHGKRQSELKKRDNSAICITKLIPIDDRKAQHFWWVKEIIYGQWSARETAFRIVKAAADHNVLSVGIEKGMAKNAIAGYLTEYAREYNVPLNVIPLTHGNKAKADRIEWALAGRVEKGRVILNADPNDTKSWAQVLIEEAVDFPDPRAHDDLLDALSYVDQMAPQVVTYYDFDDFDETGFEPLDEISGY